MKKLLYVISLLLVLGLFGCNNDDEPRKPVPQEDTIPKHDELTDTMSQVCDSVLLRYFPFGVPYHPQSLDSLPDIIVPYVKNDVWCYVLKGTMEGYPVYYLWNSPNSIQGDYGFVINEYGTIINRYHEEDCINSVKDWTCVYSKYFDKDIPVKIKLEEEKALPKDRQIIGVVGEKICEVKDIEGVVNYNPFRKLWSIYIKQPANNIDSSLDYYPLHLDEEFRVVSKKVIFSGDVFQMSMPYPIIASAEYYAIELTSLKNKP